MMMLMIRRALAASALAVVFGTACGSNTVEQPFPAGLDDAVTAAMKTAKVPGALVGVWSPDGDYVKAFGVADITTARPMDTGLFSRIGSVTKTFTATALLQLVKAGKVGLDDPISHYVDGVPGGQNITVRQLASMRSGLPEYADDEGFQAAVAADPQRTVTPQELLAWAYRQPVGFPPGTDFEYSNTNYILLGLLIEKVAGQPLGTFLEENIFRPLAMDRSSFPAGTQFPAPHPLGYTEPIDDGGAPVDASTWTASFTWAAGAAVSTLDDMRTWLPALANGTLLTPELQRERLRSEPGREGPAGFAYGMGIFTLAGWVGHNGSVPGYQTVAMYLPEREISLVVMINTDITLPGGRDPSGVVAEAVTSVITPDHVYAL